MKKFLIALALAAAANAGFISEGIQAQQSGDHKKLAEIYERRAVWKIKLRDAII